MAVCKGCGAVLQSTDPKLPGYTPKEGSAYCQRCFRIMHYDDLTVSMKTGIDPDTVLDRIEAMDCLVLWVADLFDFEGGMIPGLNRKLADKDIIMAASKKDLLPETLSPDKIAAFVFRRLKEQGIMIKELVLTGEKDPESTEEVKEAVRKYAHSRKIAVMGRANSGKSTLLNRLMHKQELTSSRYPGTTLDFNEIEIDGEIWVDTPGIEIEHSILMAADEKDLRYIVPRRPVRPRVYQIYEDQSFAIGGLARIDVKGVKKGSAVFYVSEDLEIHRGKQESADDLWQKHRGSLLVPSVKCAFHSLSIHKDSDKMDVVIDGLGWVCLSGDIQTAEVSVPENVNVTFRKAMI